MGSAVADENGGWTFTPDTPLNDGEHEFTIIVTDPAGNSSEETDPYLVIIDTQAPEKPAIGEVRDDVGPIQGSVAPGGSTDDTRPTLEGSNVEPGDVVTIIDNGEVIGSVVANENGGWMFTPETALSEGKHDFTIIVTDPAGNSSEASDPYPVIVDVTAPVAPVIVELIDDQGTVTGAIGNGSTTDDAQPEIRGTAEANSLVIIYDNGRAIGSTLANAQGSWTFTPVPPLLNGSHDISAKAQDAAGNLGAESNKIGFEVISGGNAVAPAITGAWDDVEAFTGMLDSGALTNDARPEIRGTAQPGETVTLYLDGRAQGTVVANESGQWSWTPGTDLTDGSHNFRAETTDAAGNPVSTGNFQLVIDTTAPDAGSIGAEDNVGAITGPVESGDTTDDSTPTFGGEAEPGATVIISDGDEIIGTAIVGEDGSWTWTPETPLEDGAHEIGIVIRDEAGNESAPAEPIDFIVDTSEVAISIDYAYDDVEAGTGNLSSGSVTNDSTPTLYGKTKPNSIIEIREGDTVIGSVKADSFGRWSFTTPELAEGAHSFTATATDPAGQVSEPTAEFSLIVDVTAPVPGGPGESGGIGDVRDDVGPIQGSVAPGGITDDTTPTLEGSGLQPGDVVTIIDNGQPVGSAVADENGGWTFTPDTPLNDGEHSFTIIVTDPAGNSSEESEPYPVIVDTQAPDAPVIVRIIDDQGADRDDIVSGSTTDDAQPEIVGTAEPNSLVIIYDNGSVIGSVRANGEGNWSFIPVPPLLNGPHEISARAQDAAGNIGEASESVDFEVIAGGIPTAPAIIGAYDDVEAFTGIVNDGGLTNDARPEIRGTAQPGQEVTIYLNGAWQGTVIANESGQWSWTPGTNLPDNRYTIRAEVEGPDGPLRTSNFSLTIDTEAPEAGSIGAEDNVGAITGPIENGDITDDSTPTFGGEAEPGATVIISDGDEVIGTAIVGEDGSWTWTPEIPLEDGAHEIGIIIRDEAGNDSEPTDPIDFIVDTSGATVSIDYAYDNVEAHIGNLSSGGLTNDNTPTLHGMTKPNSIVEIREGNTLLGTVQADSFGRWSFTPPPQADGEHRYNATAIDPAGAISGPTAEFVLEIDTRAPSDIGGIYLVMDNVGDYQGAIDKGQSTDDNTPTIYGSGSKQGNVITIIDNGRPIGSAIVDANGYWKFTPDTPLNDGEHKFTIIATDPAGNSSKESEPYPIIIDTTVSEAPVITDVTDNQGDVRGPVNNGDTIDDSQPVISGTAEPNSIVFIYDNGEPIGSVVVNDSGVWSFTPTTPLTNGPHNITARSKDSAGNVSEESNNKDFIVISGGIPAAPAITDVVDDVTGGTVGSLQKGERTNDNTPELKGTAPNNTVVYIIDGTTVIGSVRVVNGEWTFTPSTPLTDGTHEFTVYSVDAANNRSPVSGAWDIVVDTTAPAPIGDAVLTDNYGNETGTINNGDTTDDNTPTFSGSAEAGAIITIRDGDNVIIGTVIANNTGRWSFTPAPALEDGRYSWSATQTDLAGNESAATTPIDFIVDTSGNTVSLDYAYDNEGIYTGNVSSGSVTDDSTPTLHGSANANSLVYIYQGSVRIGSVIANNEGKWSFEVPELTEGSYEFRASVQIPGVPEVDEEGNPILDEEGNPVFTEPTESEQTPAFNLIIDLTAPNRPVIDDVTDDVGRIQGTVAKGGFTDDSTPTLTGRGNAGDLVTIRNGNSILGTVKVDSNGLWSWTPAGSPLNDGTYAFNVTLTDAAGNESERSDAWTVTVDTKAPNNPTIDGAWDNFGGWTGNVSNGGTTDDRTPTLSGKAENGSKVTIEYNDGTGWHVATVTVADSQGWSWTPGINLSYGQYQFRVTSEDAAGNLSDYSNTFTLKIQSRVIEEFDQRFTGTTQNSFEFSSGLIAKVLRSGPSSSTGIQTGYNSSGSENKATLFNGSTTRFTIPGGAGEVSFGGGSYDLPSGTRITFYNSAGQAIGTQYWKYGLNSFTAPNGQSVAYIDMAVGAYPEPQPGFIPVVRMDYLQWGEKGSGAANGRNSGKIMSVDDDDANMFAVNENGEVIKFYSNEDGQNQSNLDEHNLASDADNVSLPQTDDDFDSTQDVSVNVVDKTLWIESAVEEISLAGLADVSNPANVIEMTNNQSNVLNVTLNDVLEFGEKNAFIADGKTQLVIKGDVGDVINLSDLLPDGTDPGNWAKAEGTVTVGGVQYEVYQHSGADTELLIQQGLQTNLNNH
ncbi:Ig-like domain-containing protein [Pantoea agglomerans]